MFLLFPIYGSPRGPLATLRPVHPLEDFWGKPFRLGNALSEVEEGTPSGVS